MATEKLMEEQLGKNHLEKAMKIKDVLDKIKGRPQLTNKILEQELLGGWVHGMKVKEVFEKIKGHRRYSNKMAEQCKEFEKYNNLIDSLQSF